MPRISVLVTAFVAGALSFEAHAYNSWIADDARILSQENIRELDQIVERSQRELGVQLAVLTVADLHGRPVKDLAVRTARWIVVVAFAGVGGLIYVLIASGRGKGEREDPDLSYAHGSSSSSSDGSGGGGSDW
jgi:hypothetical protein